MDKKGKKGACCLPIESGLGRCKVEAMVSVDERGQMVLPKDIRDKAGIVAGDKLAVICIEKNSKTCCISLVKAESFADLVKDMLGPMMQEVLTKK